jgi:hypothetical protein
VRATLALPRSARLLQRSGRAVAVVILASGRSALDLAAVLATRAVLARANALTPEGVCTPARLLTALAGWTLVALVAPLLA